MPTERCARPARVGALAAWAALAAPALALTAPEAAPHYIGASLGVSHVSNIYRLPTDTRDDTVVSAGLLAGLDQRFGRQRLTMDGSLQDNRYAGNRGLDNQSHALHGALDWQTVGDLSGTLGATSRRSLADFNIGNGVAPILVKNTERNDEYTALARLGVGPRYSLEGGWTQRRRDFSAEEYDRFAYRQNTASAGIYATPGTRPRLGLAGRHTRGQFPRYTLLRFGLPVGSAPNDFTRNDFDITANWDTGGGTLDVRLSRSRTTNSLATEVRDFSGTTGAVGWNWQATSRLLLNLQYARDSGQETLVRAADVNRIYTSWQLGARYALTAKLSLSASASGSRSRQASDTAPDAIDNDKSYGLGLRWAFSRSFSLSCQSNHAGRHSSVPQYTYSAGSHGCTGQATLY